MCFVRKSLDWVFTRHELKWLDDIMPESHKREKEKKKKEKEDILDPQDKVVMIGSGAASSPTASGKLFNTPANENVSTLSITLSDSEDPFLFRLAHDSNRLICLFFLLLLEFLHCNCFRPYAFMILILALLKVSSLFGAFKFMK